MAAMARPKHTHIMGMSLRTIGILVLDLAGFIIRKRLIWSGLWIQAMHPQVTI